MPRYRYAFVAAAMFTLGTVLSPGLGTVNAQDATPTDIAQQAAETARLAACATPAAPGAPVTITGKGQTQSLPFTLDGGAYTVSWSMTEPSTIASFIHLDAAEPLPGETELQQSLRSGVILNANGKDGSAGGTHLFGVKPGKYYLGVRAPGGWSVTLTPLAV
jgi:hypothetical protein